MGISQKHKKNMTPVRAFFGFWEVKQLKIAVSEAIKRIWSGIVVAT